MNIGQDDEATASGTRVLRPQWQAVRRGLRRDLPLTGVALALVLASGVIGPTGVDVTALVLAVTVAVVALGVIALHLRASRVELGRLSLDRRGGVLPRRHLDLRFGARGVLAPLQAQPGAVRDLLVVRADEDGRVLRLHGGVWSRQQLEKVARHAGVPVLPQTLTAAQFESMVPGSMPLYLRRPTLLPVLGTLLAIALAVAAVLGWQAAQGRLPAA